ncbi:unnamed protein product [Acanthoscelides obtectus]|uniref:Uncharacterized protein n=1 Tax=Acanthoscelides obtectus TaxID=200917 RepID=A0A9P0L0C8_ACAOB|nr:unnamed protein product [Acanthoscelides obtectus]CAK1638526.1 hypothetical protein AOBTE_LOCUS10647 [Acanthoscelides obtectus]
MKNTENQKLFYRLQFVIIAPVNCEISTSYLVA